MDFVSSVKRNMTTAAYAQFEGRASRSEYWWFYLFTVLVTAVADMFGGTLGNLASLAFFLPGLALLVRRLHDVGRSGWIRRQPRSAQPVMAHLPLFIGIGDRTGLQGRHGCERIGKAGAQLLE